MDRDTAYLLIDIIKEINSLKMLLNQSNLLAIKSLLNSGDLLYNMMQSALTTSNEREFRRQVTRISKSLINIEEMNVTRADFNTIHDSIGNIAKKIAQLQKRLKS